MLTMWLGKAEVTLLMYDMGDRSTVSGGEGRGSPIDLSHHTVASAAHKASGCQTADSVRALCTIFFFFQSIKAFPFYV